MPNYHPDELLLAREQRAFLIQSFGNLYPIVVSLKANVPGPDKRFFLQSLVIGFFEALLDQEPFLDKRVLDSIDGKTILYAFDCNAENFKQRMITWEETLPYGRFIDIDVTHLSHSLSRSTPRKCFLCDRMAFDCARSQRHSLDELLAFMKQATLSTTKQLLEVILKEAMMQELDLHPKFGLVTPLSNGSHHDMTYELMKRAQATILPYFLDMIDIAWCDDNLKEVFHRARKIGLEAEKAMLEATQGINCYKGLIFNLGLFLIAFMDGIKHNSSTLSETVCRLAKPLESELINNGSNGLKMYHEQRVGGARLEAIQGFPTVKAMMPYLVDESEASLHQALIQAIRLSEDSVFAKRAKTERFRLEVKHRFDKLNPSSREQIETLTSWCIEHNLSFGGSADLLVCALVIKKIKSTWNLNNFIDF